MVLNIKGLFWGKSGEPPTFPFEGAGHEEYKDYPVGSPLVVGGKPYDGLYSPPKCVTCLEANGLRGTDCKRIQNPTVDGNEHEIFKLFPGKVPVDALWICSECAQPTRYAYDCTVKIQGTN